MNEPQLAKIARQLCARLCLLLGWRPDEFWRATPAEIADLLALLDEANGQDAPVSAALFAELKERFPDE